MKHLIALLFLVLAGCMPPKTIYVPKEVKVPVPVSCVKAQDIPQEPDYAMNNVEVMDNVDKKGAAALQELEQRRNWQREAKAALKQCSQLP